MIGELNKLHFYILTSIYMIFGIFVSVTTIRNFFKEKKIKLIYFFNIYYLITYSITPIFTLKQMSEGTYFEYLKTTNVKYYYFSCIASIFLFLICMFSYFFVIKKIDWQKIKKSKIMRIKNYLNVNIYDNEFLNINLLFLVFSWICLLLWTKAYGSIFDIFKYAPDIRDGVCHIPNKWSFLSKFCGIFIFVTYYWILNLISMFKLKKYNWKIIIGSIFSVFGCFIYLIAIDSRSEFLMFFIVFILVLLHDIIEKINIKKLIFLFGLFIVVVFLASNIQNIMNVIKNEKIVEKSNNFFVKEFSYRVLNNINTFYMLDSDEYNLKIRVVDNIIEIPFSWVPKSKLPSFVVDLNDYNTSFYAKPRGEIPADLLTASLFSLGYIGIFINPIIYGSLIGLLELFFTKKRLKNVFYKVIFYNFCCILMGNFVSYSDMAPIINAYFAFCIYYIGTLIMINSPYIERGKFYEKKKYI